MQIQTTADGFDLVLDGRLILRHRSDAPCLFVGQGDARMDMYRGNFDIEDYVIERTPLAHAVVSGTDDRLLGRSGPAGSAASFSVSGDDRNAAIAFQTDGSVHQPDLAARSGRARTSMSGAAASRCRISTCAAADFPSGPRSPASDATRRRKSRSRRMSAASRAATTGTPTIRSRPISRPGAMRCMWRRPPIRPSTSAAADFHEIEVWAVPERIELTARPTFIALVEAMSERFGRQPPLPEWVYGGAIIGLKDGANSFERLEAIIAAGTKVSGLWCEDWVGLRHTSFGARLFWDWKANDDRYPGLRQRIAELEDRGIRFLGYVNPYLAVDGSLFPEADAAGYFAKDESGKTALVDFGEFDCGVVDFTNPDAAAWFAERVIGQNMLDFGLSGWMADFGEYLPIDVKLANGVDAKLMHNAWPTLWAEVNARAVASRGKTGEALFFMRAGFTGVQKHCPAAVGRRPVGRFHPPRRARDGDLGRAVVGPARQCLSPLGYRRLHEPLRQCPHGGAHHALGRDGSLHARHAHP